VIGYRILRYRLTGAPTRSIGLFAIDPGPHRERRQSQPARWCVQRWLIRFQMIPVIYDLLGRIARWAERPGWLHCWS